MDVREPHAYCRTGFARLSTVSSIVGARAASIVATAAQELTNLAASRHERAEHLSILVVRAIVKTGR